MSPGTVVAASGGAGTSSGSTNPSVPAGAMIAARSSALKPSSARSKSTPLRSASSMGSSSMSHEVSDATLLSAMRSALTWSGVRSSARMVGTSLSPSFRAARSRVCPAMMTPSASIRIGILKPKASMLLATASTAASLMVRGLRSYSLTASMGSVSMFTAISVRTRGGKRQRVGRRGGPPHMRQVRGAGMAGSLVGWFARADGPVRGRSAPQFPPATRPARWPRVRPRWPTSRPWRGGVPTPARVRPALGRPKQTLSPSAAVPAGQASQPGPGST